MSVCVYFVVSELEPDLGPETQWRQLLDSALAEARNFPFPEDVFKVRDTSSQWPVQKIKIYDINKFWIYLPYIKVERILARIRGYLICLERNRYTCAV